MATRGDEKERVAGQHDDVGLSPAEQAAFDQLQAGYNDTQTPQGGFYRPNNSPYDTHSGYTRRYSPNNDDHTRQVHGGIKSPSELREAEDTSGGSTRRDKLKNIAAHGLAGIQGAEKQATGDNESPFSYKNTGPKWAKGRGLLKKHRKKVIIAGVAGIGVFPLLALLFFLMGALKIPHFVENMAAWRFAKVTNQYRLSVSNVINEKNAIDSLDDAARKAATAKYGKYPAFDKVNRMRPNRVLQSLNAEDRIQYEYKKTLTGGQKLTAITFTPDNDPRTRVTVNVPSGKFDRIIHPIRTIDQYKAISEALNSAMKAHDHKIPLLTRAAATRIVLQKAGASLKGMAAAKYLGKTDREAKILITQETYEKAHRSGGVAGIVDDNTKEVAENAVEASDAAMQDKEKVGVMLEKGRDMPDDVYETIERSTAPERLKSVTNAVLGFANPIYDIAVPVCMAYEGSRLTPDGVDAQQNAMISEAAFVLSTGDQQKAGRDAAAAGLNVQAINAMNWKMGDIQESNVIRRVSGKPVNTLDNISSQRTSLGNYSTMTIFDAFGLGVLNSAANDLCPTLSSFWFGAGLGVVNITAAIFTGGAASAASASISKLGRELAEKSLKDKVALITATATRKSIGALGKSGRFAKEYSKSIIKYGAVTAAAVFLARQIVYQKAGLNASGAEAHQSFDDNVDNGTELLSGEIGRGHFRARPLNNVEAAQSHEIDRQERGYNNKQLNTFQRYLSLENSNSMISRTIITTGSLMERSTFASALNSIATVFNPVGLTAKMFATMNATTTIAAGDVNTEDYGNVVWTYSLEEQRLMGQDTSYSSPSENEYLLDQSGKEQEINDKYDKCYTKSIGTLLTSGDLVRTEEGDVLNEGDCSPLALGPHNPTYGDLVFRWRLKYNYNNTTDMVLGVQDPAKSNTPLGSLGDIPSGTAQELAKQILNNGNIKFQVEPTQRKAMERIAATGKANECGAPEVSPKLLGLILAAASKYKIVVGVMVDGHRCNNGYHPKGTAVDFNGVSTLDGSDSTGNDIGGNDFASSKVLRSFYGELGELVAKTGGGEMGQYDCFASPKPNKNSKVEYFNRDPCDHVHVGLSN